MKTRIMRENGHENGHETICSSQNGNDNAYHERFHGFAHELWKITILKIKVDREDNYAKWISSHRASVPPKTNSGRSQNIVFTCSAVGLARRRALRARRGISSCYGLRGVLRTLKLTTRRGFTLETLIMKENAYEKACHGRFRWPNKLCTKTVMKTRIMKENAHENGHETICSSQNGHDNSCHGFGHELYKNHHFIIVTDQEDIYAKWISSHRA